MSFGILYFMVMLTNLTFFQESKLDVIRAELQVRVTFYCPLWIKAVYIVHDDMDLEMLKIMIKVTAPWW